MKPYPNFYCLEGVNKVGKTTLANAIKEELGKRIHNNIHITKEPTSFFLNKFKKYEHEFTEPTLGYLYTADRYEHVHEPETGILAYLKKGYKVLCDRYAFSTWAYQGHESFTLSRNFIMPEAIFYIHSDEDIVKERNRPYSFEFFKKILIRYENIIKNLRKQNKIKVYKIENNNENDIANNVKLILSLMDLTM